MYFYLFSLYVDKPEKETILFSLLRFLPLLHLVLRMTIDLSPTEWKQMGMCISTVAPDFEQLGFFLLVCLKKCMVFLLHS